MSKRSISMLLAVAAILSLAAPAFAQGAGPAEEPAEVIAAPAETPETSAEPTEEPDASTEPTEEPEASAEPTEEPEAGTEPTEEPAEVTAVPTEEPAQDAGPTETPDEGAGPAETEMEPVQPVEGGQVQQVADEPAAPAPEQEQTWDEPDSGIMTVDLLSSTIQALNDAVAKAQGVQAASGYEQTYTKASRDALTAALKTAADLQAAIQADQSKADFNQIANATSALEAATAVKTQASESTGLDPFATAEEKAALEQQYSLALGYPKEDNYENNYLPQSRTALGNAITQAEAARRDGMHKDVVQATQALTYAIGNMQKNQVTSGVLQSGYYATQAQAQQALQALGAADYASAGAYEMYLLVKQPTAQDVHGYYVKASSTKGTKQFAAQVSFSGGNGVVHWKPADLGLDKMENGTTISCTLYSFDGSVYSGDKQLTMVGDVATITIDTSYEGPVILSSGWSPKSAPGVGNNTMYVTLDCAAESTKASGGIYLKLTDPAGKSYPIAAAEKTKKEFAWTWDTQLAGSAVKAPEGSTLTAGTYKVELYGYVQNADGTTSLSAAPVQSVSIVVGPVDVTRLQQAYDKLSDYPSLDKDHWVTDAAVDAAVKAKTDAEYILDNKAIIPGTLENDQNADAKAAALTAALAALEKKADYSALDAAIARAESIVGANGQYTSETLNALVTEMTRAKLLSRAYTQSQQSAIDAQTQALNDAIARLQYAPADWTAFDAALASAKAKRSSGRLYTDETKQALDAAIQEAETLAKSKSTLKASEQARVNAAAAKLNAAVKGLAEVELAGYVYGGGKWISADGKWYYKVGAANAANAWIKDGGKWYYVAKSGVMATGWALVDEQWYYFNPGSIKGSPQGAMQTGWLSLSSGKYYLNSDGSMAKGWKYLDKTWYYFNYTQTNGFPEGAMIRSKWVLDDGVWYYLNSDGSMKKSGKYTLGGQQYYFSDSGAMVTGWKRIGGTWYYFNPGNVSGCPEGAMVRGNWIEDEGAWYYLNSDGSMKKSGKYTLGGQQYYFNESGAMAKGWKSVNHVWYYFNPGDVAGYPEGAMVKNSWVTVDGKRYYLGSYGNMLTGAQQIGSSTFFLDSSGAMYTGWRKDGDKTYYYRTASDNGAIGSMAMNEWLFIGDSWYYFYQDGQLAVNTSIDGYRINVNGTRG